MQYSKDKKDSRGGKRVGAGRPKGGGRFGEATVPMRVPKSMVDKLAGFLATGTFKMPLYSSKVVAGFPSPADDFVEKRLDANDLVVDNPAATFFLRVTGDSMRDAGIIAGDYIVVDRSAKAKDGAIVVAAIDGEFTVKYLYQKRGQPILRAANPQYKDIVLAEGEELVLFGVVRGVVRRLEG